MEQGVLGVSAPLRKTGNTSAFRVDRANSSAEVHGPQASHDGLSRHEDPCKAGGLP
jgi:hypothetical protein